MNLDEPNQTCSNSNNGGDSVCRSLKKQKQKKIPQRGLGVAQLEKIRIEEHQKKDSASSVFSSPPFVSPANFSSLTLPLLNYPTSQLSSSTPFPSPSSKFVTTSQNPILSKACSIPKIDTFYLNSVPTFNHSNGEGGFDVGWPLVPSLHDSAHLHKMWHPYEFKHDSERDLGLLLPPDMSLPSESSPIMPLPDIMTRAPQFSQACASVLMNMPLVNCSSILNIQMEPPSNQSLFSSLPSLWLEQEKMASAKRPYPFRFNTPLPSFHNKHPRIARRSNESTPFRNGSLFNSVHDVPTLREIHLLPSSNTVEPCSKGINKETKNQYGDFLTLVPPSVASPHPIPRWSHSLPQITVGNPIANSPRSASMNHRIPEKSVPYTRLESTNLNHRNVENPTTNSGQGPNGFNHHQPFFSFFPALKVQKETSTMNIHRKSNENGEIGGIVDLNLKL